MKTIAEVAQVCKALNCTACSDSLWLRICQAKFADTDPTLWIAQASSGIAGTRSVQAPTNYRSVYRLLSSSAFIVGLWRGSGSIARSHLYEFHWEVDCIVGTGLRYESMRLSAIRSSFHRIGPDRLITPELISDKHCVLRQTHINQKTPSRAAESVAAVAMNSFGSSPTGDIVLGSSPQGSFEHEMLRFMQGAVASKSRRRRSSRNQSSGGSSGESTTLHHLCHVHRPVPTARHPLQGLWKGDYGPNGVQIVQIMYDFSGSAARLIATKVTGDDHVPAGRRTWHALAAPQAEPWNSEERDLINLRELIVPRLPLGDDEAADEPPCNVVAAYAGKGKVAGLNYFQPRWVEGRLWQYDDGGIGFLWIDAVFQHLLVDLKRIDDDFR
ncbi:hypothetical protein WJX75_000032 [Coccomyxa subellipsoidea]|uniref:F-box domain-containing protein n=1 Tax=Coccomyxa subellipsoidea TaxID=248742 RepID=A0ABR2YWL3_9CHLO